MVVGGGQGDSTDPLSPPAVTRTELPAERPVTAPPPSTADGPTEADDMSELDPEYFDPEEAVIEDGRTPTSDSDFAEDARSGRNPNEVPTRLDGGGGFTPPQ